MKKKSWRCAHCWLRTHRHAHTAILRSWPGLSWSCDFDLHHLTLTFPSHSLLWRISSSSFSSSMSAEQLLFSLSHFVVCSFARYIIICSIYVVVCWTGFSRQVQVCLPYIQIWKKPAHPCPRFDLPRPANDFPHSCTYICMYIYEHIWYVSMYVCRHIQVDRSIELKEVQKVVNRRTETEARSIDRVDHRTSDIQTT